MSPKNKVPKPPADRAEQSKAEAIATAETAAELPTPQVAGDNTMPPIGREETPEGVVQESRLIKM
jgi:hypothetical protein